MEQVFTFDLVRDTQSVFRKMLDVCARPFVTKSIRGEAAGFKNRVPQLLALGCTLLDNETSFYVEKDEMLSEMLADYTLGHPVSAEEADYLFLSSLLNYETIKALLSGARKGTLSDPHKSASFLIFCPDLEGDVEIEAEGPGIDKKKILTVTPYISTVCRLRQELQAEYPCGIDLFFVDEGGNLIGVPRMCRVSETGKMQA